MDEPLQALLGGLEEKIGRETSKEGRYTLVQLVQHIRGLHAPLEIFTALLEKRDLKLGECRVDADQLFQAVTSQREEGIDVHVSRFFAVEEERGAFLGHQPP